MSPTASKADTKLSTTLLELSGMSCASCAGKIQRTVSALPGVTKCSVNFAIESASIEYDQATITVEDIVSAIEGLGYQAYPDETESVQTRDRDTAARLKRQVVTAIGLSAPLFILEMGGHLISPWHQWIHHTLGDASYYLQFVLATLVIFGPGRDLCWSGLLRLFRAEPDMNSLVALGSLSAYLYSSLSTFLPDLLPTGNRSVYFESAALIITLILVGKHFESKAKGKAGEAILGLLSLNPDTALVIREGQELEVPLEQVQRQETISVKPGSRIPVDGEVIEGDSYVEESMLTGEPVPVHKTIGSKTFAGTVNQSGAFLMRAENIGRKTMLSKIVKMVKEAQSRTLEIQSLVDKVTRIFVPVVLLIAAVTFLAWWNLGPDPKLTHSLIAAVAVLIIACPCAMGLATPTSILVGTGIAAELGILFRGGDSLQKLESVKIVAFDKTGTLTEGKPSLTDLEPEKGFHRERILQLVASVESKSEHPVARALVESAQNENLEILPVSEFRAVIGQGVVGIVDGHRVAIGSERMMESEKVTLLQKNRLDELSGDGKTCFLASIDGKPLALLAVADRLKPSALQTVTSLHRQGLKVALITGDRFGTANPLARKLGIDQIYAEVLPEQKAQTIEQLQSEHGAVVFVGDGINDAPALAQADVGIAIGSGTDIAVESADVVLMGSEISGVDTAIALSRATITNIKQNLFWAFAYNIILIPVAAGALYPHFGLTLSPVLAATAMTLSSIFVLLNALRLKQFQPSSTV